MVGDRSFKDAAFDILDDMSYRGSAPAKHRKADLEHLDGMIKLLLQRDQLQISNGGSTRAIDSQTGFQDFDVPSTVGSSMNESSLGWQLNWSGMNSFYPAQMDSMAQALGSYNAGADFDDISNDRWLWNDAGLAIST